MKRAAVVLLLLIACGTATSGATYTASGKNPQTVSAAADFGVTVSVSVPAAPLHGTTSIDATATETNGGTITQVVIERSPAGAGTWTAVCTDNTPAYSCSLNTTALADGEYDFRARATNNNGYTKTSAVVAGRLVDNTGPSVTLTDPGAWFRGTITLGSTVSDNAGGSGVASVRYEYKLSSGSTWSTACTGSSTPFTCSFATTGLTNGTNYDFRAVATDVATNATTSAIITNRRPDNVAPNVATVTDPGTNLRGTITLNGTAGDALSGVASARMQFSAAGANSWSDACTDLTSPFTSCSWDTTGLNGLYDLRTIVTDVAGNTLTSAAVANRRVDNTAPLTSLTDPGSPLSGTLTLNATGTDTGGSGVNNVRIQRSPAGSGTWTDICTDSVAAYSCSWNTTTLTDGLYDLRSVATDNANNTGDSTTVANRRVDNYVPSGSDVQTSDGGGTPGVIQTNDTITLTYSEPIDPASIIAGWNGLTTQNVYLRFAHHNQGDRVLFYNATNSAMIPLATSPGIVFEENYIPSSDATFTGTLTRNATGNVFTVTLGALTAGGVNGTAPPAATMVWYPSNGARDFLSKACSTTQRTELGGADIEF